MVKEQKDKIFMRLASSAGWPHNVPDVILPDIDVLEDKEVYSP